jgi:predicted transposase YbfD/YdcC
MAKKSMSPDQLMFLAECCQAIKDPRVQGRSKHLMIDIIVIAVVATVCGAEGIKDIYLLALSKQEWFKKYLELPNGIPSQDTIARVLAIIDPGQLEKAFLDWVKLILGEQSKSISIDGKYSKGTERTFNRGKKPLLIVSAYSHDLGLSLVETEGVEGSEIDGAMACLDLLDLKDVFVHVDAGIGSKEVAHKIVQKGGKYILPLKGNQRLYRDEVDQRFEEQMEKAKTATTEDENHGRQERRSCFLLPAEKMSEKFTQQWPEAKTLFAIVRERVEDDKRYIIKDPEAKKGFTLNNKDLKHSEQVVYYVSNENLNAKKALTEARQHWGIENKLHWVLDVAFREDQCGVRAKDLARKLSLIRKISLNIIRASKTKGSVRGRIKMAGWSNDFLDQLLFK